MQADSVVHKLLFVIPHLSVVNKLQFVIPRLKLLSRQQQQTVALNMGHLAAGELGQAANAHKRRVAYETLDTVDRAAASRAGRAAGPKPTPRYGLHAKPNRTVSITVPHK